jgi:hypothetical protein
MFDDYRWRCRSSQEQLLGNPLHHLFSSLVSLAIRAGKRCVIGLMADDRVASFNESTGHSEAPIVRARA